MTPMIDVVFLLLIFFVCTASFQKLEEYLPAALSMPNTSGKTVEPIDPLIEELEPIVVKVLWRDGQVRWRVGEADYDRIEQVRAALETLASLQSRLPVILDVDGDVPVGDMVLAYDTCRLSGFYRVQFAADVR